MARNTKRRRHSNFPKESGTVFPETDPKKEYLKSVQSRYFAGDFGEVKYQRNENTDTGSETIEQAKESEEKPVETEEVTGESGFAARDSEPLNPEVEAHQEDACQEGQSAEPSEDSRFKESVDLMLKFETLYTALRGFNEADIAFCNAARLYDVEPDINVVADVVDDTWAEIVGGVSDKSRVIQSGDNCYPENYGYIAADSLLTADGLRDAIIYVKKTIVLRDMLMARLSKLSDAVYCPVEVNDLDKYLIWLESELYNKD